MSASLDQAPIETRLQLANAIRRELEVREFGERAHRVVLAVLCASLDRGRNKALFPKQIDLARVARLSKGRLSEQLKWLDAHCVLQIGKDSDGSTLPEPNIYILRPPPYTLIPIRSRFVPLSDGERELWRRLLSLDPDHPVKDLGHVPMQVDAFREPYGVAEAMQDTFNLPASPGVLSGPDYQSERTVTMSSVVVGEPGVNNTVAGGSGPTNATAAGETPRQSGNGGESIQAGVRVLRDSSSSNAGNLTKPMPGESIEAFCLRVQENLLAHSPLVPHSGTDSRETPKKSVPESGTQGGNRTPVPDSGTRPPYNARTGDARAQAPSSSSCTGKAEAIAVEVDAQIERLYALAPGEMRRYGPQWIAAAAAKPNAMKALLDYYEHENRARIKDKDPTRPVIEKPLSWLLPTAVEWRLMERPARKK